MFRAIPTLHTPRLELRKFELEDAPALYAYASDPLVTRYITWITMNDPEQAREFIQYTIHYWYKTGEVSYWAIVERAEGHLIGSCGLFNWDDVAKQAELAFVLARPYWGQGIISEAVRELMRYAFEELHLNRLEARCVAQNVGSARVMEKTGMTYEGTLPQNIRLKGHLYDLKVYSLLREEWERSPQRTRGI